MAESFKDKVADELHALGSKYYGLEDAVSLLKDDQEAREYLWAARTAIQRMPNFSQEYLEEKAPTLADVIYGEIPGSKIDYDKTFGKDWYKNFGNIDYGKVQHVAMKAGEDPKKVLHEMAEEATRRQRYDIAHGGIDGKITTIVFPRATEAVEQGRSPETAEVLMDAGQIGSYAVPYGGAIGRLASAIPKVAKFGKAVSTAKTITSNVAPPLINEGMDAYYYDDEENPRSEFSWSDVGGATAMNFGAPFAAKMALRKARQVGNSGAAKSFEEFGGGETAKEASKNIFNTVKPGPNGPSATSAQRAARAQYETRSPIAKGAIESKNPILFEIAAQDGKNLEEKTRRYLLSKGLNPDKYMVSAVSGPVPKNMKAKQLKTSTTENLVKAYDELGLGATEGLKTAKDLWLEEAEKNLVMNKWGDYGYEGDPWQFVPFGIGSYMHKKNAEEEAEQKKLKQAEDLYKKWEKKIQEVYGE